MGWSQVITRDGVGETKLDSWKDFDSFQKELLGYEYIFRGHKLIHYDLLPILFRKQPNISNQGIQNHLIAFKESTYGKLGQNPTRPSDDIYWWSMGQHFGLYTQLMDWTVSPFIALFFAFEKARSDKESRVVWALYAKHNLNTIATAKKQADPSLPPMIKYKEPVSDFNYRLIAQMGKFIWFPEPIKLDDWIRKYFPGDMNSILMKIEIPDIEREECLKYLNRMNINHKSIHPDLHGVCNFANTKLEITGYYS